MANSPVIHVKLQEATVERKPRVVTPIVAAAKAKPLVASVVPKKAPSVKRKDTIEYNAAEFAKHKQPNFIEVDNPYDLMSMIKPLIYNGRKLIAFDTETYGHYSTSHDVPLGVVRRWVGKGKDERPQDFPFALSVCDGTNSFVLYDDAENEFRLIRAMAPLFEDTSIEKIAHNAKFDMHMLQNIGMKIRGKMHDTVVLSKLTNENRQSYELKELSKDGGVVAFEHMVDSYKALNRIKDYRDIPHDLMTQYTCADTWNAVHRFLVEYPIAEAEDLLQVYETEMQVMMILYQMERRGMHIRRDYEEELIKGLEKQLNETEAAIYKDAGRVFNVNSTQQLYNVLIETGMPKDAIPMTAAGNPSLAAAVMEELQVKFNTPMLEKVLELRRYERLYGTYAKGIYGQRDNRYMVHGNINQTEAVTGRMSIGKPGLQQIPRKDTRIRSMFIPDKQTDSWYFCDLDQVEYRIFASYCKSQALCDMISAGVDVHKGTASIVYNVPVEDVKPEERTEAKYMNFALLYGAGADKLALMINTSKNSSYIGINRGNDDWCTKEEALAIKRRYFEKIPEFKPFVDSVQHVTKVRGYVKNFYGRRRRLSGNDCFKAPNSLIQGCAADFIKNRLVNIYKYIMHNKLKTTVRNIIHDELIFNVPDTEREHMPVIRWLLSDFENFRCAITAGIEKADGNWGKKIPDEELESHGFVEPYDKGYLQYDVFDGHVFDIDRVNYDVLLTDLRIASKAVERTPVYITNEVVKLD
jgi:DNA polymerase-1